MEPQISTAWSLRPGCAPPQNLDCGRRDNGATLWHETTLSALARPSKMEPRLLLGSTGGRGAFAWSESQGYPYPPATLGCRRCASTSGGQGTGGCLPVPHGAHPRRRLLSSTRCECGVVWGRRQRHSKRLCCQAGTGGSSSRGIGKGGQGGINAGGGGEERGPDSMHGDGTGDVESPAGKKAWTPESLWESLEPALSYLPGEDKLIVQDALQVAFWAHEGQQRKSGEPFIVHPVEVTRILAELEMDWETLVAGLLHDTVEDTERVTFEQIGAKYGPAVRRIVEGETKVSKLGKVHSGNGAVAEGSEGKADVKADDLRQMFLAMTEEVRVIIVKLADRLHNMRTLGHMPPQKRGHIARETLRVFAPLARLLGMYTIKSELEDLSFRYAHPGEYTLVTKRLGELHREQAEAVREAEERLRGAIARDKFLDLMTTGTRIQALCKEPYSVFRKTLQGNKGKLEELQGVAQILVVLELRPEMVATELCYAQQVCYHVMGLVHGMWPPLPGSVKDYIATPKPNGYQSLHTTVLPLGARSLFPLEVQIRTEQMDRMAERGITAHLGRNSSPAPRGADASRPDRAPAIVLPIKEGAARFSVAPLPLSAGAAAAPAAEAGVGTNGAWRTKGALPSGPGADSRQGGERSELWSVDVERTGRGSGDLGGEVVRGFTTDWSVGSGVRREEPDCESRDPGSSGVGPLLGRSLQRASGEGGGSREAPEPAALEGWRAGPEAGGAGPPSAGEAARAAQAWAAGGGAREQGAGVVEPWRGGYSAGVPVADSVQRSVSEVPGASDGRWEGELDPRSVARTVGWLNAIREWQEEFVGNLTAREFVDTVTGDLLGSRIFVFTPRGEVKNLPKGATVIDYAYGIHTDLGNQMYAAKVNGNLVSPTVTLSNADVVEVLTYPSSASSQKAYTVRRQWLQVAKTRSARHKLTKYLRDRAPEVTEQCVRQFVEDRTGPVLATTTLAGTLGLAEKPASTMGDAPGLSAAAELTVGVPGEATGPQAGPVANSPAMAGEWGPRLGLLAGEPPADEVMSAAWDPANRDPFKEAVEWSLRERGRRGSEAQLLDERGQVGRGTGEGGGGDSVPESPSSLQLDSARPEAGKGRTSVEEGLNGSGVRRESEPQNGAAAKVVGDTPLGEKSRGPLGDRVSNGAWHAEGAPRHQQQQQQQQQQQPSGPRDGQAGPAAAAVPARGGNAQESEHIAALNAFQAWQTLTVDVWRQLASREDPVQWLCVHCHDRSGLLSETSKVLFEGALLILTHAGRTNRKDGMGVMLFELSSFDADLATVTGRLLSIDGVVGFSLGCTWPGYKGQRVEPAQEGD